MGWQDIISALIFHLAEQPQERVAGRGEPRERERSGAGFRLFIFIISINVYCIKKLYHKVWWKLILLITSTTIRQTVSISCLFINKHILMCTLIKREVCFDWLEEDESARILHRRRKNSFFYLCIHLKCYIFHLIDICWDTAGYLRQKDTDGKLAKEPNLAQSNVSLVWD